MKVLLLIFFGSISDVFKGFLLNGLNAFYFDLFKICLLPVVLCPFSVKLDLNRGSIKFLPCSSNSSIRLVYSYRAQLSVALNSVECFLFFDFDLDFDFCVVYSFPVLLLALRSSKRFLEEDCL